MKADYDAAQGEDHWRTYLHLFDRYATPAEYTVAVPTLIRTGDGATGRCNFRGRNRAPDACD